jgi:hypothetical protein
MITDYSKILSRGKENAIPAPILAEMMHFKTTRKLAADIARSRAAGQIICSSTSGGYYLPATRDEIREFINTLENRAKKTFISIRSAKAELAQIEGQEELFSNNMQDNGKEF